LLLARTGVPRRWRVARGRRAKLSLELRSGAGELHDVEADPDEMDNRFGDAACASEQAALEAAIRARRLRPAADAGRHGLNTCR
jgi:hypothetical protein